MAKQKYKPEDCLLLLQEKQRELHAQGLTRYPMRSDFEPPEVVAIKAYFGPWPRALEAAGIKEVTRADRADRNRERRIRAKQSRRAHKDVSPPQANEPTERNEGDSDHDQGANH